MPLPPFPGMPPPGAGAGGAPNLSSPELNAGGPSPEQNTLLASPLADRLGGGLQQQHGQIAMLSALARKLLQAIAKQLSMSDPKAAADVEAFAARLLKISATAKVGPPQIPGMANALPGFPQQQGMNIPPPVGGTGAFAGPMAGLGSPGG